MVKKILKAILRIPLDIYNSVMCRRYHIVRSGKVNINGLICAYGKGRVFICDGVRINSSRRSNAIGGETRTIFQTCDHGCIEIGEKTGISNSAFIAREKIKIGKNVKIGGGCKFYDNDFHAINYDDRIIRDDKNINSAPIVIKDGAFIGAHSIILKGVTIGEKSIIGAGSVVTKDIPDGEMWAGNPAKRIRKCSTDE